MRLGSGLAHLGDDALQLLQLDGVVSADVVASLAADLEEPDGPCSLVIDDYHLTDGESDGALSLLLDYRPTSLQLVVATRIDPSLRLARMRANEELIELRDRDLSFSEAETQVFLNRFHVQLDERQLTLVHQRSEGWAAGLQMAAITIHSSPDPTKAVDRVTCTTTPSPVIFWMKSSHVKHRTWPISCWPLRSSTNCPTRRAPLFAA